MTTGRDLIARARRLALDGDERALAATLSPHFFARLASGRIVSGPAGFHEAVSYETVLSSPVRPAFGELDELGGGFVLAPEPDTARSGVRPGAWLLHVKAGRLTAALHFESPEAARRSLPQLSPSSAPTAVIERAIAASNRGDLVELVSLVSGDFTLVARPGANPVVGVPSLLDLLESIAAQFDSYELVPVRIRDCGAGYVLVEGYVAIASDGELTRASRAILAHVDQGRATGWTLYETVEHAREALRERTESGTGG